MFSLFSRKKRTRSVIAEITNGRGDFAIDVVGESHYQHDLDRICGGKTEDGHRFECEAILVLEDDNPHDEEAVRVNIGDCTVGYLPRSNARIFRRELAAVAPGVTMARCKALIVGGWSRDRGSDQGHFGVKLNLPVA